MKYLSVLAIAVSLCVSLLSCSDDITDSQDSQISSAKQLTISSIETLPGMQTSRAAYTTTAWSDDDRIGVSIYKDTQGNTLFNSFSRNICWSYSSEKWNSPYVTYLFPEDEGYVTAYYPYTSGADPKALQIDNTKDWMYALLNSSKEVSFLTPAVTLKMLHATSQIKISIVRKGYSGVGKVESVEVSGTNIANKATLNTLTGTLSNFTLFSYSYDVNKTLESGNPSSPMVIGTNTVIPVTIKNDDKITVKATIDGSYYEVVISQYLYKGNIHNFTIYLTDDYVASKQSSRATAEDDVDGEKGVINRVVYLSTHPDSLR